MPTRTSPTRNASVRGFRLASSVVAILLAFVLVGLLQLPAVANVTSDVSQNWAGFASYAPSGSVSYAAAYASWVVPTATCIGHTSSSAASWVGLDGFHGVSVEQIGVDTNCLAGSPTYFAWWEVFDARVSLPVTPITRDSKNEPFVVKPGYIVSASVLHPAPGNSDPASFLVQISTDNLGGGGQSFSRTVYWKAAASSAECIAEAPKSGSGIVPLADFGVMTWMACDAVDTQGYTHVLARGIRYDSQQNASLDPTDTRQLSMARGGTIRALTTVSTGGSLEDEVNWQVTWYHK